MLRRHGVTRKHMFQQSMPTELGTDLRVRDRTERTENPMGP
jgi:hypothetical protein